MKTAIAILFAALAAQAADLRLVWDAVPTATNYVLYATGPTNSLRMNIGTNLFAIVPAAPGQWKFEVAAQNEAMESARSAALNVQVIAPPANVRLIQVQISADLKLTQ